MLDFPVERLKLRVCAFVGVILITVVCISVWTIRSERREAISAAERRAEGYVRVLAEHSETAFAQSDRVLRDLLHDVQLLGGVDAVDRRRLFEELRSKAADSPQIGTLFLVDKDGILFINSSEYPPKPIRVADREYFRHYVATPGADLTLSRPVMSRMVHRWRFNLIRPLNRPGEKFAGLAAVAFEVQFFNKFLGTPSLGSRGRVLLVRSDGAPLVVEPYHDNIYQANLGPSLLFREKLPVFPAGTYHSSSSVIDATPRIISYQRLTRFPVVAIVSLSEEEVLDAWRGKAVWQSAWTAGLCLVIVALAALVLRHLDRLRSALDMVVGQQEELRVKAAQIDAANDAILQLDPEGRLVHFNQALSQMTGYSVQELTGLRLQDLVAPPFGGEIPPMIRQLEEHGAISFESAYLARGGETVPVEVRARIMESERGTVVLNIARDITQRKRWELREEARLSILEEMATGSPLDHLLLQIVSFVEQEIPGALCSVLLYDEAQGRLYPGAAPSLPEFYNRAVNGIRAKMGAGSCGTAAHLRRRVVVEEIEGHPYWEGFQPARDAGLRACWSEPILSSDGKLLGTFAVYFREPRSPMDEELVLIESAAHLASLAIGHVRGDENRARLEEQLRQVQKIEAIGQLAGGVAHDFNNLLTPILVYADLLRRGFPKGDPEAKKAEGIISAANKAKDLTQKLLSFGRKQMLSMEVMDLNEVITSFRDIMRRTIRENIALEMLPVFGGADVLADRGQIEQIILNLVVNAQDAIASNGCITVATARVLPDEEFVRHRPGMKQIPYVLLSISDDGCGMSDETLRHIFEPFYTTKPVGHGTGLGLATVYGIVKQHDGYIEVKSAPDEGASFDIYLPAAAAAVKPAAPITAAAVEPAEGEGRTVLVVEDNEMVREMAVDLLISAGYRVLVAEQPSRALAIAALEGGSIDLLVTDVVMPQMNGPELYSQLVQMVPGLPVLYMSGYARDIQHGTELDPEMEFLRKPFTTHQFLESVGRKLPRPTAS